jgi:AzlC protein
MRSVASTVLTLVLFATYLGIGALAHDTHFSLGWALASTALVWAGPAQIILISTLGSGATVVQAAIAVTVSAIRLFPMVVSVLPMMRTPQTKRRHLVLATHFIAVTLWVECFRLLPQVPRERRIAFTMASVSVSARFASLRPHSATAWRPTSRNCSPRRSCC